jgi:hypothetical protein
MWILISIALIYGVVNSIYYSLQMDYKEEFIENSTLLENLLFAMRVAKLAADIFVHLVFFNVVKFLLQYRNLIQG